MSENELRHQLESLFSDDVQKPEDPSAALPTDQPEPAEQQETETMSESDEPHEGALEDISEEALPPSDERSAQDTRQGTRSSEDVSGRARADGQDRDVFSPNPDDQGSAASWGESEDELLHERLRILNLLLGGATIGGGVAVLALIVGAIQKPGRLSTYIPFLIGYALIVAAFLWRRVDIRWRAGVLIGVPYIVAIFSVLENGVTSTAPWYLLAIPLLFFILVGERAGIISGVANALLYVLLATAYRLGWLRIRTAIELSESLPQYLVVSATFALIIGIVVVVQWLFSQAQRRVLQSLQEQSAVLRGAQAMSQRRQQELEVANVALRRQATHFELGIQVGRIAAMGLGLDEFTERAVELIRERLDLYYVSLFLLDEERAYATLQASAGEAGEEILSRQSQLAVSGHSLLRQCVNSGQARVAQNIDLLQDLSGGVFLLAETRSAIALPMIVRGRVAGVITVQSRDPVAFRHEDVVTLRTVADQVSTAVANAQLSEALRARLQEMEALQRYYVREAWEQFLPARETTLYEYVQVGVPTLGDHPLPEVDRVLAEPKLAILDARESSAQSALVSPISLRDQVFGVLGLHQLDPDQPWTEDQIELVAAIADQMGLMIENSRLFEEAQSRARRERQAREITAHMRQSLDVETVLQTAVREMGEALGLHDVTIQFQVDQESAVREGD